SSVRVLFSSIIPRPRRSTLFPYTTLFRSRRVGGGASAERPAAAQPCARCRQADDVDHCGTPLTSSSEVSGAAGGSSGRSPGAVRSEEHTSELQSLTNLVCRLLLGKKKHES